MADYVRNRLFFTSSTLLMLGVAVYMSFSLVWIAPVPAPCKLPLTALIFLLSQCITGMRALVTWKPDLDFRLIRAGGYLSSSFMLLAWQVLIRDALLLLLFLMNMVYIVPDEAEESIRSAFLSLPFEAGMVAVSLVAAAVGMFRALRVPPVARIAIPIPRLPSRLEGLRIVHLSDLHVGSTFTGPWLEAVVDKVNALAADFVFITGDLADGSPERLSGDLYPLTRVQAKYGVLLCPGNHDYYSGLKAWTDTWRSWGLDLLLNEHRTFTVRGETVVVGGVTDPCALLFHDLEIPDTRKAFQGAPEGFRILLAHRPGEAEQNAALGCRLQLSGHTHGGQFFFLFPLVSRMNKGFRSGLYRVGRMRLYVCPGTGMWGYVPMRLGVAAEISLLELKGEKGKA